MRKEPTSSTFVLDFIRCKRGVEVIELLRLAEAIDRGGEWVDELPRGFCQLIVDFAEVFKGETFERIRGLVWGKVGERTAFLIKPEPIRGGASLPSSKKEHIAFLLFPTRIPVTLWVRFPPHPLFGAEGCEGSVQQFIPNTFYPTPKERRSLAAEEIQWVAHVDLILGNRDRHFKNILVDAHGRLIPIDHTYALLPKWRPCTFCWLSVPGISEPIFPSLCEELKRGEEIVDVVRAQGVVEEAVLECERRIVLERCAVEADLTYFELGSIFAGFGTTSYRSAYAELITKSGGIVTSFRQEAEKLCAELAWWKERASQVETIEEGRRLLDESTGFVERMIELWLGQRSLYPRGCCPSYILWTGERRPTRMSP